jgi:hypothetical protein
MSLKNIALILLNKNQIVKTHKEQNHHYENIHIQKHRCRMLAGVVAYAYNPST